MCPKLGWEHIEVLDEQVGNITACKRNTATPWHRLLTSLCPARARAGVLAWCTAEQGMQYSALPDIQLQT